MSEQQKLVPKLRFPEFRGAVDWEEGKLISLSSEPLSNGVFNDPKKAGAGYKLINVSDMYIETTIDESRLSLLELSQSEFEGNQVFTGDIFFTRSSLVKSGIAVSNIYLGSSGDVTYDGHLIRFRANIIKVIPLFAHYLFKTSPIRAQLIARGKTATMTTIGQADVASVTLFYPKPDEQKHIADCLSSLDELIAAQVRKVEALKTHKKGLMQQLFPREGETQPRIRFPEFKNVGDWEFRTIGEMFDLINGCAFKPDDWKPSGTPIIRIQNLNDPSAEFNYSQKPVPERNRVEPGELLFAWSGTLGSSFGARVWNGPSGVLNQHIFKVLMDEQRITLRFALLVLARVEEDIARRTHGFKASFVHVKKSDLAKVELLLPSLPEQQHIAECLRSLDTQISAETQKLDALKTHKKGLMQQLFPAPEAAEA